MLKITKTQSNCSVDKTNDVGLDINAEKIKDKFMPCEEKGGKNHNINLGIKSFKNVTNFKCLEKFNKSKLRL